MTRPQWRELPRTDTEDRIAAGRGPHRLVAVQQATHPFASHLFFYRAVCACGHEEQQPDDRRLAVSRLARHLAESDDRYVTLTVVVRSDVHDPATAVDEVLADRRDVVWTVVTPGITAAAGPTVVVRIENSYECGRESTDDVVLPAPGEGAALTDWWDDVVHDHTGDGHPCGSSENGLYEVTIVDGPAHLVGESYSWEG